VGKNRDFIDFEAELKKANQNKEFKTIIEEKMEDLNIQDKDDLPVQDPKKHNKIVAVRIDGVALTEDGALTKSQMFGAMYPRMEMYGDMVFSVDEARTLNMQMHRLKYGINSVVALKCNGPSCVFALDCPYQQMNKAPIGKPCIIEADLLQYHSQKFFDQLEVDPDNHVEVLLVQELSELLIYEMRLSRVLAGEGTDGLLMQKEESYDKQGNLIINEKVHWAWEAKEKIKNKRMKLLESLMATRKSNDKPQGDVNLGYASTLHSIVEKIEKLNNAQPTEIKIEE
jgi:hypothetical protein